MDKIYTYKGVNHPESVIVNAAKNKDMSVDDYIKKYGIVENNVAESKIQEAQQEGNKNKLIEGIMQGSGVKSLTNLPSDVMAMKNPNYENVAKLAGDIGSTAAIVPYGASGVLSGGVVGGAMNTPIGNSGMSANDFLAQVSNDIINKSNLNLQNFTKPSGPEDKNQMLKEVLKQAPATVVSTALDVAPYLLQRSKEGKVGIQRNELGQQIDAFGNVMKDITAHPEMPSEQYNKNIVNEIQRKGSEIGSKIGNINSQNADIDIPNLDLKNYIDIKNKNINVPDKGNLLTYALTADFDKNYKPMTDSERNRMQSMINESVDVNNRQDLVDFKNRHKGEFEEAFPNANQSSDRNDLMKMGVYDTIKDISNLYLQMKNPEAFSDLVPLNKQYSNFKDMNINKQLDTKGNARPTIIKDVLASGQNLESYTNPETGAPEQTKLAVLKDIYNKSTSNGTQPFNPDKFSSYLSDKLANNVSPSEMEAALGPETWGYIQKTLNVVKPSPMEIKPSLSASEFLKNMIPNLNTLADNGNLSNIGKEQLYKTGYEPMSINAPVSNAIMRGENTDTFNYPPSGQQGLQNVGIVPNPQTTPTLSKPHEFLSNLISNPQSTTPTAQ